MKYIGQFFAGFAILIIAAVIFLQNTTVGTISLFYRINGIGVGPILLIMIAITFIAMLVKSNWFITGLFGLEWIAFFVFLIMSIDIHINRMSGLQLVLEIGLLCVGIAMMIRGMIGINSIKAE